MEELCIANPKSNREHFYFLSLGYARLKNYTNALNLIKSFLDVEPENAQMQNWQVGYEFNAEDTLAHLTLLLFQKFLQAKLKKEATIGLAVTTGTALVIGGLVGLGLSLLKR